MNVVNDVLQFWKETWQDSKLLFFAEAIGTLLALTAATILTLSAGKYIIILLLTYIVSNFCFIYASYHRQSTWLLVMSIGFVIINVAGIIINS